MRTEQKGRGLIVYHKDTADYTKEDLERVASLVAQGFDDSTAAQVPNLFPAWAAGKEYAAGTRITDGKGNLFRVVQGHVSAEEWAVDSSPALYTKLGVSAEDPEAVPDWVQPTGAQDAYAKGDQVRYQGKVYESLMDGNAYAPDVYPAGWAEVP